MADENEQQTACKAGRDEQHCKCKQRREAAAAAEAAAANGEHGLRVKKCVRNRGFSRIDL